MRQQAYEIAMRISSQNLRAVTKTIVIVLLLSNASLELPTAVYGQARSQANSLVKPTK